MRKPLAAGVLLLGVGLMKILQHTSAPKTLEDYLAFRCGSDLAAGSDSLLYFAGHCWGCPVAVMGAAMILFSIVTAFVSPRKFGRSPARPRR